ncbi:MAG: tol-pal system protein YbgF [bacterium]|nr:tol-pal system protein YbgF [bacterium]
MRRLLLPALILPIIACTSGEDMALLHREITDVQRQVQQLETSTLDKGDLATMEQRLGELTNKTMRSNADLSVRVERLQEQIEALHATLEITTRRLQSISQELAAARAQVSHYPTIPPVTSGEQAPAATRGEGATEQPDAGTTEGGQAPQPVPVMAATPEELYRSSYEDYMRGNYDLASQGFIEYLRRWPNTDLADNAQYWVGECYDALDRSEEALAAFTRVLEDYPTSDKAAAAQLKKGLLYLKLGDNGQGVVHLQYVVYEHPGTNAADLAREKLRSLGFSIR